MRYFTNLNIDISVLDLQLALHSAMHCGQLQPGRGHLCCCDSRCDTCSCPAAALLRARAVHHKVELTQVNSPVWGAIDRLNRPTTT